MSGALPKHLYIWVRPNTIGMHGWLRAVWFGLASHPSRAWGCHVLLECGAIYRNIPLHHLATASGANALALSDVQVWDCYGLQFSTIEYPFLSEMRVKTRIGEGFYLFTAVPIGDGFSAEPEQAKEFFFVALDGGQIASLPTNHILFNDRSFVRDLEFPTFLTRQTDKWSVED